MLKVRLYGVIAALALVCAGGWGDAKVFAQGAQKSFTDRDLRNFAKAYVDFHRIKNDYDGRITRTQDAKERERLQKEGDAKVAQALQKQGFTMDSYSKTFAAVNNNEPLRKKTLKYIEEERKRS
jgi:Domain of unknown function (DUF4168)